MAGPPPLKSKPISPHTLRHTAAMRLLNAGVDITVIALWLGHESTKTTQIYLHVGRGGAGERSFFEGEVGVARSLLLLPLDAAARRRVFRCSPSLAPGSGCRTKYSAAVF
jgi:hypothetical protein